MKLPKWKTGVTFVVCLLCLPLLSCGKRPVAVQELAPLSEMKICRIAVLPFTNLTDYRDGGVLLTRIFTAELFRLQDFQQPPEGDVREAYRQVGLNPYLQQPALEKLQFMRDFLGVEAFIAGHITEMGEKTVEGKLVPFMTVTMDLINAKTGTPLVKVHHQRSGEDYLKVLHFGLVTSMTELASLISGEIIKDFTNRGLIAQCSD